MKQILSKLICRSNLKHLRYMSTAKMLDVRQRTPHFTKQYLCTQPNADVVTIRLAGPEDYNNVLRFMRQHYFHYEPICLYLGLTGSSVPTRFLDLMYWEMEKGYTLVAETEKKQMVASAITTVNTLNDIDFLHSFMKQTENQALYHYLEFVLYLMNSANIWKMYGVTKYFEGLHLAVNPEYRHTGIGLKLIIEELLLAQRLNFRLYRADTSSRFSIQMAERIYGKYVHTCRYEEYLVKGQPIFKNVREPHTEVRVYVKELLL